MSINILLNTLIHILILILLFSFFIKNKSDKNTSVHSLCYNSILCYMIEFVRKPDIMNINVETFQSPVNPNPTGPYNKLDLNVDQLWHLQ